MFFLLLSVGIHKFVQRAKMIKNRAIRNEATHGSGLALQQENAGLKKLLADQVIFFPPFALKYMINVVLEKV